MNTISPINFCVAKPQNIKKLVPLKEYKGKFLKLTPEDKKQIAPLEAEIKFLEERCDDIRKSMLFAKTGALKNKFQYMLNNFDTRIDNLKTEIREIKIDRLRKQRK